MGSRAYLSAARAAPPENDATAIPITAVNLARCIGFLHLRFVQASRPRHWLGAREASPIAPAAGTAATTVRRTGPKTRRPIPPPSKSGSATRPANGTAISNAAPAVLTLAVKRTRSRTVATRPPAAPRRDVAPIVIGARTRSLAP